MSASQRQHSAISMLITSLPTADCFFVNRRLASRKQNTEF
jgi:hypothetical protein